VTAPPGAAVATAPRETLAGLVERVTFHNEETGFCVLRVKARGQRDLVTVVGHAAQVSAGEWVSATGVWVNDRQHGLQLKADHLKATQPTTVEGIERYLGSGMIRGVGPVYAKRLVAAFGERVFELVEREPDRLREVTGIGPKRASRIVAGWAEQRAVREGYAILKGYAILMGRLSLPTLLATAAAPMVGAWLLGWVGPTGTLAVLCGAAVLHVALVLPLLPVALRRAT
jgi:exodeoxyribonuclease V alpha subunit